MMNFQRWRFWQADYLIDISENCRRQYLRYLGILFINQGFEKEGFEKNEIPGLGSDSLNKGHSGRQGGRGPSTSLGMTRSFFGFDDGDFVGGRISVGGNAT